MKNLWVRVMIFILPLLFLSVPAFSFTQFTSPSEEESISSFIQIGSFNKKIQIRLRNAALTDVLKRLTNKTNIQFRVPDDLASMRINADIVAPSWNIGVKKLLESFSKVSLLDKHGKLNKVVLLKNTGWIPQSNIKEKKLMGQSVPIEDEAHPSDGSGKNSPIAPGIVLSKSQLRTLAKGPYGRPLPARLFEKPKYRAFLARHGIESREDLNVITKAKAVRRAARQQLRSLRKPL